MTKNPLFFHLVQGVLWLSLFTSLGLAKDDSDRLLKLAKKDPIAFVSTCAVNRNSLAKIFITKYEWEVSQADPEFSILRKFTAKSGELEIASLNSGRSLPSLEYAYFLVWAKGGNSCAIEIRYVPPSSNITRFGIQEIEISSTTIEDVYQIQVTSQTETINPDAENPNLTLRQYISKDRSLIQIAKNLDVKFHAAEIPIYDSGDGTQKKSKPRELMLNFDVTGSLEITAKTSAIAKQQKPWIGKYHLNFEPSSTTSQPVP
jgi:hypothetical protein